MQGTLDNPPIVITQDQGVIVFMLFLMIGLVLTAVAIGLGASVRLSAGLFMGFTFGGGGAWLMMPRLIPPRSLTLDENGLTWDGTWKSRHFAWSDFSGFAVIPTAIFSRLPGCVFSESYAAHPVAKRFAGGAGSFGPCWEMTAQEMVTLLGAAKQKWG
jgi:hypothetical protein